MIQNHLIGTTEGQISSRESGPLIRKCGTAPRVFRSLGFSLPALDLLGALLSVPRLARANSGNSFLETIGMSVAVGTVLGASTLPFYDQPGNILTNLAFGTLAGAVIGIGGLVNGLMSGPSRDGPNGLEHKYGAHSGSGLGDAIQWQRTQTRGRAGGRDPSMVRSREVFFAGINVLTQFTFPVQLRMPVVSLNW